MPGDNREISCVSAYTDDILVQPTATDYLERQLGRVSIYANNKVFAP